VKLARVFVVLAGLAATGAIVVSVREGRRADRAEAQVRRLRKSVEHPQADPSKRAVGRPRWADRLEEAGDALKVARAIRMADSGPPDSGATSAAELAREIRESTRWLVVDERPIASEADRRQRIQKVERLRDRSRGRIESSEEGLRELDAFPDSEDVEALRSTVQASLDDAREIVRLADEEIPRLRREPVSRERSR